MRTRLFVAPEIVRPGGRRERSGPRFERAAPGAGPLREGRPPSAVARRDSRAKLALVLADCAALGGTLAILGALGGAVSPFAALAALVVLLLLGKAFCLYDRDEHVLRKGTLDEAPRLLNSACLSALGLWLAGGAGGAGGAGRREVLIFIGVLLALQLAARVLARSLVARRSAPERCLVVGDAASALRLAAHLGRDRAGAELVGRLPLDQRRAGDPDATPEPGEPPVLGPMSALSALLVEHRIGRVILAPRNADAEEILDAIRTVKGLGIKVSILPRLFEAVESSVEFDDLGAITLLAVRQFGLPRSSRAAKRGLDVVGSAAGLVVLAPVLAAIALAIRLQGPGPVLFRQTRIGRDGREFQILKFRSMVVGADDLKAGLAHLNEADGLFKIAADPRITRLGAFLRRTSLDELPQLWNVLWGEMSLVGPRPLVAEDDRRVEGWERRRLGISPGMTGAWQLLGSSRIPLAEMVKIDYLYIANWTLWSDVKILLRTVPYVLARRGM